MVSDVAILNELKAKFAGYYPVSFIPQYAFIATWNKLKYSSSSNEVGLQGKFQMK